MGRTLVLSRQRHSERQMLELLPLREEVNIEAWCAFHPPFEKSPAEANHNGSSLFSSLA